jgi:hypothetical protein
MNGEYIYKGQNLTTLILAKIEHVVSLIAERESLSFELAYHEFMQTKTYRNLINTQTLLWGESAEFIVDDYIAEINSKT